MKLKLLFSRRKQNGIINSFAVPNKYFNELYMLILHAYTLVILDTGEIKIYNEIRIVNFQSGENVFHMFHVSLSNQITVSVA